jgi:acyl carrier protein
MVEGATQAVREAVATACNIPMDAIGADDDVVDDLNLDNLELISLGLILEEIFCVQVPETIFESAMLRTASGLAGWLVRRCEEAEWAEVQRQRKRA